jgi:LuxR family maltose regulon positive regulatory protein
MRARAVATYVTPVVAVTLRLHLARLYLAMSEIKTARHLLREIDDIRIHRSDLGRLTLEVEEVRSLAASVTAEVVGASPLTPAEMRVLPYLQTHLSFQQIGERLFVSRNTIASQVQAIYRKLAVSTRDAAVARAVEMGFVGG